MDEKYKFDCSSVYHQEGDINIGLVLALRCDTQEIKERYHRIIPFIMAVDEININSNLLTNITLGFTILNNCQSSTEQRLIQFLPDTRPQYDENYCKNGNSHPVWFDVVAIISTSFSRESVEFSYITKLQKISLFTSAEATSDEFTDKSRYPHFFRTVSGDSKQVDFMLHFLRAMNWVYVNVIYTIGPYGENAAKQLNLKAEAFGICIEVLHMVTKVEEKTIDYAVNKLLRYQKAKVVIGFFEHGGALFEKAILRKNAEKDFIFLGSDTVYFNFDGVFRVQPVRTTDNLFYSRMEEFFYERDAKLLPEDPWIRRIYADKHNCSWISSETENICDSIESDQPLMDFTVPQTPEVRKYIRAYDVAHLYAKGIDKTIHNNCKYVSVEDRNELRSCVKENLATNMKYVENDGTVKIKLDENGDAYARWRIYQIQKGASVLVATYDETEEPKLRLMMETINWSMFGHFSTQNLTIRNLTIQIPESVCSKPCHPKDYFIQQELPCCWDCRKCYVNEYIVNGTSCKACPFGQWPDEDTATFCTIIETTYLKWSSWITLLLAGIIVLGLFFTIYATVFYVIKRKEKIIKATTRELCCIILFGILMTYLTALFYFFKPAYWSCLINRHGFNLSVILIYSPLFVKTNRVFRIFHAGQKGIRRAKYIDTSTQIVMSTVLILIEVNVMAQSHCARVGPGQAQGPGLTGATIIITRNHHLMQIILKSMRGLAHRTNIAS